MLLPSWVDATYCLSLSLFRSTSVITAMRRESTHKKPQLSGMTAGPAAIATSSSCITTFDR